MTATACLPTMQNLLPSLFAPEYWASEDVLRNPWQRNTPPCTRQGRLLLHSHDAWRLFAAFVSQNQLHGDKLLSESPAVHES